MSLLSFLVPMTSQTIFELDSRLVKLLNPRVGGGIEKDFFEVRPLIDRCWPAGRESDSPIVGRFVSNHGDAENLRG